MDARYEYDSFITIGKLFSGQDVNNMVDDGDDPHYVNTDPYLGFCETEVKQDGAIFSPGRGVNNVKCDCR